MYYIYFNKQNTLTVHSNWSETVLHVLVTSLTWRSTAKYDQEVFRIYKKISSFIEKFLCLCIKKNVYMLMKICLLTLTNISSDNVKKPPACNFNTFSDRIVKKYIFLRNFREWLYQPDWNAEFVNLELWKCINYLSVL